jgi:hypothetical protein
LVANTFAPSSLAEAAAVVLGPTYQAAVQIMTNYFIALGV